MGKLCDNMYIEFEIFQIISPKWYPMVVNSTEPAKNASKSFQRHPPAMLISSMPTRILATDAMFVVSVTDINKKLKNISGIHISNTGNSGLLK